MAYIGLSSNLDNPFEQIINALYSIQQLPSTHLMFLSNIYLTKPLGPIQSQPDYLNGVCMISTELSPYQLNDCLKKIEIKQHREKKIKWGPRTIDLDLLIYDDYVIQTPSLTLPHPGLIERDFVLVPLMEINPQLVIPSKGTLQTFLSNIQNPCIIHLFKESASVLEALKIYNLTTTQSQ